MKTKLAAVHFTTLGFWLLASVLGGPAFAQGTAFTYQGRLNDAAGPASGNYDLTFSLWNAVSGPAQIGGTLTNAATVVSNGLFTVTLDYGNQFPGADRWLEIGVRTNGGGAFTNLVPRQPITATPYAVRALDAGSAATYTGAITDGQLSTNIARLNGSNVFSGAVQFSNTNSTFKGSFAGNGAGLSGIPGSAINPGSFVTSLNTLKDDVVLQAGSNATLNASGNTLTVASTGAGIWNLNGTNTFFNAGKVAIGTNAPAHRLSIAGGPLWTAYLWTGAIDLENASAIGWHGNAGGKRFGIGQSTGGLYFFRATDEPGAVANVANYDMQLTDAGNLMIAGGTERAGVKLQVNGGAAFGPMSSGADVQIGSPNGEAGMTIIGTARADIRFDNSTLKLLAGPAGGPPSASVGGISIATSGKVGVGTTSPAGALHVASGGLAVTGASSPYTGAGSGVFLESGGTSGNLFAFNYSTFTPLPLVLNSPGGNVGIGAATTARLNVVGTSGDYVTPAFRAANTPGLAGQFLGRVTVSESLLVSAAIQASSGSVSGSFTKGSGSFKIDHPLDPANKYLYHSFVESPDMMNVYNGNTNLDANGEAMVPMPEWFTALNKDFRYQLTAIGAPGPNLYIAEEVTDNHFKIAGGGAGAKVSWQVTGIRQDAWASAHRIQVEEEKSEDERGTYLHPELFGQPAEKDVLKVKH